MRCRRIDPGHLLPARRTVRSGRDRVSGAANQRDWTADEIETLVDQCISRTGSEALLANVDTRDVARDMDIVCSVRGDEQLTYPGQSCGTRLGAVYAEMFPGRARAMALDLAGEMGEASSMASENRTGLRLMQRSMLCSNDPRGPWRGLVRSVDLILRVIVNAGSDESGARLPRRRVPDDGGYGQLEGRGLGCKSHSVGRERAFCGEPVEDSGQEPRTWLRLTCGDCAFVYEDGQPTLDSAEPQPLERQVHGGRLFTWAGNDVRLVHRAPLLTRAIADPKFREQQPQTCDEAVRGCSLGVIDRVVGNLDVVEPCDNGLDELSLRRKEVTKRSRAHTGSCCDGADAQPSRGVFAEHCRRRDQNPIACISLC